MEKRIVFGTDGIRGRADQWPFLDEVLYKLARAFARWSKSTTHTEVLKIMIGTDTRASAGRIKKALFSGIQKESFSAELIDCEVIPTPALSLISKKQVGLSGAIMISASHNPFHDNGIKFFDGKGEKLTQEDEEQIVDLFSEIEEEVPLYQEIVIKKYAWQEEYLAWLKNECLSDFVYPHKVVLDCAHGATVSIAKAAFESRVKELILVNVAPTGENINENSGALYVQGLIEKVRLENASIGFAFDGDGDRVIAVDKNGIVRDGDDILALLLSHPEYQQESLVVGTIMSNSGFEQWLHKEQKKIYRTSVGDKYVAAAMKKEAVVIGGEPSGHIILSNYIKTGDGILVALKTLEAMILAEASFEKGFERFEQVHESIVVAKKIPLEELECYPSLEVLHKNIHPGRLVIRYSGTEPVLRVMVEHYHSETAHSLSKEVLHLLRGDLL